tara:strand:+ start:232 stop:378 length:147 start_codon:yes stop_codon:yes gene_type:complete
MALFLKIFVVEKVEVNGVSDPYGESNVEHQEQLFNIYFCMVDYLVKVV